MKQRSTNIEKTAKRLVKRITEQEIYGWPPVCVALCYQPARPKKEGATLPSSKQIH